MRPTAGVPGAAWGTADVFQLPGSARISVCPMLVNDEIGVLLSAPPSPKKGGAGG